MYGGMDASEARRLKALEDENGRLKRMLADAMLDNVALNANSTRSRARIPRQGGRGFHAKVGTDSTGSWAPSDLRG